MERKKLLLGFFVALIYLNFLAWRLVFEFSGPAHLKVVFFDVGQGDAVFIETPQKHQILIDGGPGSGILEKLSSQMPFYDRSLDLIILSHPERDHLEGLIEVLEKYKVDYILWTGVLRNTPEFQKWKELLKKEKAKIKIAKAGQRIFNSQFFLDIFYPFESLEGREFKNSNDASIVGKLSFGENSFLFTGDISQSTEKELTSENLCSGENSCSNSSRLMSLDSDVLKVAHHGSKTSTSEEFLEKVWPEVAIIQVGKDNLYNHPHQEVLERLKEKEIKVLRTDEKGDIKIVSDGTNYKIFFSK